MKVLKLFLLLFICNNGFGQKNTTCLLFNKGVVTYVDNSKNVHFAVSFKGDTVIPSKQYENFYFIDTTLIQIHKYPIPEDMKDYKWDSKREEKLLKYFSDYEFDYRKKEVYKQKLKSNNVFFENKYSKRFLLLYYKMPDNTKKGIDNNSNNDAEFKELNVEYQIYLFFTTNNFVTLINIPVFNNEKLERKLDIAMKDIANTVRVSDIGIDLNMLNKQIEYNLINKPLVIIDTINSLEYTIPFWLNTLKVDNIILCGTFPDIDNICNALAFITFEKDKFDSFSAFENKMLHGKTTIKFDKLESKNSKITRYKVIRQTPNGKFICQLLFFDNGSKYGYIGFTATETTYEKNVSRFDEFIESLKFSSKK